MKNELMIWLLVIALALNIKLLSGCICSNSTQSTINSQGYSYFEDLIDVMLIVTNRKEYGYISSGDFWYSLQVMRGLSFCAFCSQPKLRIHIFSRDRIVLNQAAYLGYIVHDLASPSLTSIKDDFMNRYSKNHFSVNDVEYEGLCFYRWLIFAHVVREWSKLEPNNPIRNIISFDSDVLMLMDLHLFRSRVLEVLEPKTVQSSRKDSISAIPWELVVVLPGALHIWSAHGMVSYAQFINSWYSRDHESIKSNTKLIAGYIGDTLHFSDMQMVEEFVKKDELKRSICLSSVIETSWRNRNPTQSCFIQGLQCVPLNNYDSYNSVNYIEIYGNQSFKGQNDPYPFCLMHFKGDEGKKAFRKYSQYAFVTSNHSLDFMDFLTHREYRHYYSEYHRKRHGIRGRHGSHLKSSVAEDEYIDTYAMMNEKEWMETKRFLDYLFTKPLLFRAKKQSEIYYIDPFLKVARRFPDFDTFSGMGFNLLMLHKNMPIEFIKSLPEGPMLPRIISA